MSLVPRSRSTWASWLLAQPTKSYRTQSTETRQILIKGRVLMGKSCTKVEEKANEEVENEMDVKDAMEE